MKLVVLVSCLIGACLANTYDEVHAQLIDKINAGQKTWTAGYNEYFSGKSVDSIKGMMGTKVQNLPKGVVKKTPLKNVNTIPSAFDSATTWPQCKDTIMHIRDQADCGSCWAVAAAEMITDRHCIGSNGALKVSMSAEDLMSCCWWCGQGCGGGYPIDAVRYWAYIGIVTGGDYGEGGCMPYQVPPCSHHTNKSTDCHGAEPATPTCTHTCSNTDYAVSYTNDKHFATSEYYVPADVQSIQTEIMTNGPVEAAFNVYQDFLNYQSGVYSHTYGDLDGGHAVKIVGWGTDQTLGDYWVVNNSWNTTWGAKGGQFWIKRGTNECGIEGQIVGGLAKV